MELNEAIDDRNFPPPSQPNSASLHNSVDHGDENGVGGDEGQPRKDSVSETGYLNGYSKWANRPKPLDLNGVEKMFNVPGSSQTPRTSTTPGIHVIVLFWGLRQRGRVIFHQEVFCKVPCQLQTFVELLLSGSEWMACRINVVDVKRGVGMPSGSRQIYMSMLVNGRVGFRSSLSLSFYGN